MYTLDIIPVTVISQNPKERDRDNIIALQKAEIARLKAEVKLWQDRAHEQMHMNIRQALNDLPF